MNISVFAHDALYRLLAVMFALTTVPCIANAQAIPAQETELGSGAAPQANTAEPEIGPETGLPIPRFVSIGVNEANMRHQPSTDHAVLYIYLRVGLPMKVLEERGDWRYVADHEGIEGWMKRTVLDGQRTYRVMPTQTTLYARPDLSADIRAFLEEGVVGTLRTCTPEGWCRATADDVTGWLRAEDLWGVFAGESF